MFISVWSALRLAKPSTWNFHVQEPGGGVGWGFFVFRTCLFKNVCACLLCISYHVVATCHASA